MNRMTQQTLFPDDPGPADQAALDVLAAVAEPRAVLIAAGFRNLLKSSDLFAFGYSVSHWLNPAAPGVEVLEFNPDATGPRYRIGFPRLTARTYAEQVAVHRAIGVRVVGPGEELNP